MQPYESWRATYQSSEQAARAAYTHMCEQAALREAAQRAHDWMERQARAQSKGCHATFDLMMLREERDALAEALAAAQQGVHPENIREGVPYDNPEFEQLARDMGVWGTAQSAVCAQFWLAATQPAAQGMEAGKLLAEKHTGMMVDYRGLLGQVQREIERSAPGHAEMIRQLQGHLEELGQRWYAGDTAVVDEILQLYCIEIEARKVLAAQAKQGGE